MVKTACFRGLFMLVCFIVFLIADWKVALGCFLCSFLDNIWTTRHRNREIKDAIVRSQEVLDNNTLWREHCDDKS